MKRIILLFLLVFLGGYCLRAQLEVREDSFKRVEGFLNINTDKMYDDNDKPYAVLKIRTENINNRQRRELSFSGDARTFFEVEYHEGEVWLYISYYASFIKISHPDLSTTEFWFPYDMQPKGGYELVLVNKSESNINEERIMSRIDELAAVTDSIALKATEPKEKPKKGIFTFMTVNGAYSNYGDLSYGLTIGSYKKFGWYLSAMTNFNFDVFSTDYKCGNDQLVDGHMPVYSGKESYTSLSVMAGFIWRVTQPMALRIGAGYGVRNTAYELTDGKWALNKDISAAGVDAAVGVQFNFGGFVVSLDAVTTNFKIFEAKLGIGAGFLR
jgi:hypothetical protein